MVRSRNLSGNGTISTTKFAPAIIIDAMADYRSWSPRDEQAMLEFLVKELKAGNVYATTPCGFKIWDLARRKNIVANKSAQGFQTRMQRKLLPGIMSDNHLICQLLSEEDVKYLRRKLNPGGSVKVKSEEKKSEESSPGRRVAAERKRMLLDEDDAYFLSSESPEVDGKTKDDGAEENKESDIEMRSSSDSEPTKATTSKKKMKLRNPRAGKFRESFRLSHSGRKKKIVEEENEEEAAENMEQSPTKRKSPRKTTSKYFAPNTSTPLTEEKTMDLHVSDEETVAEPTQKSPQKNTKTSPKKKKSPAKKSPSKSPEKSQENASSQNNQFHTPPEVQEEKSQSNGDKNNEEQEKLNKSDSNSEASTIEEAEVEKSEMEEIIEALDSLPEPGEEEKESSFQPNDMPDFDALVKNERLYKLFYQNKEQNPNQEPHGAFLKRTKQQFRLVSYLCEEYRTPYAVVIRLWSHFDDLRKVEKAVGMRRLLIIKDNEEASVEI